MSKYDFVHIAVQSCGFDLSFEARDPESGELVGAAAAGWTYALALFKANAADPAVTFDMTARADLAGFRYLTGHPGIYAWKSLDLASLFAGGATELTLYGDLNVTLPGGDPQLVQRIALDVELVAAAPPPFVAFTDPAIIVSMGL